MTLTSLFLYVFVAIIVCFSYFHIANFAYDNLNKKKSKKFFLNSNARAYIFIATALLVLIVFIIYPVLETLRLSFYNNTGFEFVDLKLFMGCSRSRI